MSDVTEVVHEPGAVISPEPAGNEYDGSKEAYEAHDLAQSLEDALENSAETKKLEEKIENLESSESENTQEESKEAQELKNDNFSSKFAALSRREKQLRDRESAYEQKIADLEAKFAEFESKANPPEPEAEPELPLEYRLKKDPLGTLKELGLSYDKLTNLALNDGKLTTDMQLDLMRQEIDQKYSSEIESLRNELLERDKKAEEQKYEETVSSFKNEITNFVNDNDKYELIRANNAVDIVYDVIEQHYQETERILSKSEAADQVESYLEAEVEKLLKLNKLKNKFGAQEALKSEEPVKTAAPKAPTLSNAHSAAASKPSRPRTRDQSVASAASLLKWSE